MSYKTVEVERDELADTTKVWTHYGDRAPTLIYDSTKDPLRARGGYIPLYVLEQLNFSKIIIK